MKQNKIIYYDKTNIDHILFCLLYDVVWGDDNLMFIDYHRLNTIEHFNIEESYAVYFLEHLPKVEWYELIDTHGFNITSYTLFTKQSVSLQQIVNYDTIENVFDDIYVSYNNKIHKYIFVDGDISIAKYLKNRINLEQGNNKQIFSVRYKYDVACELIKIFDDIETSRMMKPLLVSYLYQNYFSGNKIEHIKDSIYNKGPKEKLLVPMFKHYSETLEYHTLIQKFSKVYRDTKFCIIEKSDDGLSIENFIIDKTIFVDGSPQGHNDIRLIQVTTTDIKQSLIEHNMYVWYLHDMITNLATLSLRADIIEYHNPITKQSVFVPFQFKQFNVSYSNMRSIDYIKNETNMIQILLKYYYNILLHLDVPSEVSNVTINHIKSKINLINPLMTLTPKIDDYTKPMDSMINNTLETNLKLTN